MLICFYNPAVSPTNNVYHIPQEKVLELFNRIITLSRNYEHFIIYVDIKMLNVDWNNYTSTCDQTQLFLDRMIDYNMQQEVNFKTASYGILDCLFVNSKTEVIFCKNAKTKNQIVSQIMMPS